MSRVTRNIVYNGLGQGLSVVLGFVAVRFVFRRLGGDALGLIYFSLAVSTTLSIAVQLGICESAVREVAAHHKERPEYIRDFIRTSSLLYWVAYLTLAALACVATPYLIHYWVKLDSLDALTAARTMRILVLAALLTLPMGLYKALLVGLQHMGITNLIDVGGRAVQQGGIFLIILAHGTLLQVAFWIAACNACQIAVYMLSCSRYFSVKALLTPGFSRSVIKENMGYASGLMIITLGAWMVTEVDKIVLSKLLPLALLGIYTFARGAINQGTMVTASINNAVFPHFSALHGAGKTEELRSFYSIIQELICLGTVPVFAVTPFAALIIFPKVFDARSAHMLLIPATFLCIGYYMNGTLTAPYVVSLSVGRPDITARQNVLALVIVPPISALAIYKFGLNGAGFSWVIYHIYAYSYGLPRICRECLGIPARLWYWRVLRIMIPGILIYGSAWLILAALHNFSVSHLVIAYALGTLIYIALAVPLMSEDLRQRITEFFGRFWLKGRAVVVVE